jgi:hypothetical protein
VAELLEVFKDVRPSYTARSYARRRGSRTYGRYLRAYEVAPREGAEPLTLERLKAYAERLQSQHPEFRFYLEDVEVDGRSLVALRRSERPIEVEEALSKLKELHEELDALGAELASIKRMGWLRRLAAWRRARRLEREAAGLKAEAEAAEAELRRLEEAWASKAKPFVTLFFDLKSSKVYITKADWEAQPKLCTWALHRCLGALGIATTKYRGYVARG